GRGAPFSGANRGFSMPCGAIFGRRTLPHPARRGSSPGVARPPGQARGQALLPRSPGRAQGGEGPPFSGAKRGFSIACGATSGHARRGGWVESRKGAVAWPCGVTPFPFPAHQTGRARLRHPAFRLISPQGSRRRSNLHAVKTLHAEVPEYFRTGEPPGAAPWRFVSPSEEASNAIMDVVVDGPISRQARAIAEIRRPTGQKPVQSVPHYRPRARVARLEQIADPGLDPLNALLGWACARIPMAVFPVAVRAECVTTEIEALIPSVSHRGFRLVERQPELRHHRFRPRQSPLRAAAAEDDEVVGVRDD